MKKQTRTDGRPRRTALLLPDFNYVLAKNKIAKFALPKRTEAKLLVLDRKKKTIEHRRFSDIVDYFEAGDVLVLNNTKVIPARLFGRRKSGARIEILVMEEGRDLKVLLKPSARVKEGEEILIGANGHYRAHVLDGPDHKTGIRHLRFKSNASTQAILADVGRIPLPPYIDREDAPVDRELYQTVFAKRDGAVASPTAGLHFDKGLLARCEAKGVSLAFVTLHVSYGTFQPVQVTQLSRHKMYEEYYEVPVETAEQVNQAKLRGKNVVACGTTAVRSLESAAVESIPPEVTPKKGYTRLFIYPPYNFKIPDRLITNFHLPKSTLLMLTSAFAGHEQLMQAYQEAIEKEYRFYSYGDAMLII